MSGMCRSDAHAGVLEVDRSTYHYRSRRPGQAGLETADQGDLPRRVCAMAIGVCMCCCGVRVGTSTSSEHTDLQ